MANFTPTKQQQDVLDFFVSLFETKHDLVSIFLNAVAGAGKTSTIMLLVEALAEAEQRLGRSIKACSLSFNTNIRDASQAKLNTMGSSVQARTTNQLGRGILVNAASAGYCRKPGKLENGKYRAIIEDLLEPYENNRLYFPSKKEYKKAITAVKELVQAVRNTRGSGDEDNLISLILHYTQLQQSVEVASPAWPLIVKTVNKAIAEGIRQYKLTGIHDFDDQIVLPLDLDVAGPEWDVIFIDEAQDLNRARLEMITRSIKPNGVLFFVGDPAQAIQGFTYADTNSVGTIKHITGAIEFPLSVCWRCDSNIISMAQELVPHIEARNGAPSGIVGCIPAGGYIDRLQSGCRDKDPDLVLSRVKAPLVIDCLAAIRAGKSAIVRGRDIGSGIIAFLDDTVSKYGYGIDDFDSLLEAVERYTYEKIEKLNPEKDEAKIAEFEDQSATIEALIDGYKLAESKYYDLESFKKFVESKFSDTTEADERGVKPIVFSTIHKAKGLEYDRVFIIETKKLPHPAAKEGWQLEQEYNIIYVAVTRAKHELYFVGTVPACLLSKYHQINGSAQQHPIEETPQPVKTGKKRGRPAKEEEDKRIPVHIFMDRFNKAALSAGRKAKFKGKKTESQLLEMFLMESPSFRELLASLETEPETEEELEIVEV